MLSDPSIVLAINCADFSNKRKSDTQAVAMSVLSLNRPENVKLITVNSPRDIAPCTGAFSRCDELVRDSLLIGNNRPLPYIKDIFNACSGFDCDIFGYMNSDILVKRDFFDVFATERDAYYFYRNEIGNTTYSGFNRGEYKGIWGGDKHSGNDAFFFKNDWWKSNSNAFPDDLILGETEWDTAYRTILQNETPDHYSNRSLYHVYHDQIWNRKSVGAKNNIAIWKAIRKKYRAL